MATINKNSPATVVEINYFLKEINFKISDDFVNFYKESDGCEINLDNIYFTMWSLSEMIELNNAYNVEDFAPDFFLIGSDGGGNAISIKKDSGFIYEIPFVGMDNNEAIFKNISLKKFIEKML